MSTNFSQFKLGIELTASNAVSWFKRMTLLLQLYDGCWKAVTEDTGTDAIKARARLTISMNVGDDLLHIVDPSKSPKVIWDALKAQFVGVSAARKMSLQKMQTSFKKESAESLDDFIARANDLGGQLATAIALNEDAFVLLFLAALSESSLAAWAQSLLAHKPLMTYANVIENMRGTFSADMLTKREAPAGQQAYAVADSSGACAYCHKPGHNILQCFKLRNDQRTNDEGISVNHQRGGNNARGNARGGRRGRGGGRGRGGRAQANFSSAFLCISANQVSASGSKWLFDSACTDHMVNDVTLLHDAQPYASSCTVANNHSAAVTAKGTVRLTNHLGNLVTLRDVLLVPNLQHNLISLSRADEAGMSYNGQHGALMLRHNGYQLLRGQLTHKLYEVDCTPQTCTADATMHAPPAAHVTSNAAARLWHCRFGHTSITTLAKMSRGHTLDGLPPATAFEALAQSTTVCTPCAQGKMQREGFPASEVREQSKFAKLHADIAGPFNTSAGGKNYFLMVVDDHSSYKIVELIERKSDAAAALQSIVLGVEKKYNIHVHSVRFDRDSVFLSNDMRAFLTKKGIQPQPTSGYSPQENGHAERAIRTVSQLRDALLADSGLQKSYWGDALMHAAHLSNITCSLGGKSPWEIVMGTKLDITNIRLFGCTCWYKLPHQAHNKRSLPPRANVGKFIGYAQPNFKAFRVLLPHGKVFTTRDVMFDESAPPASDMHADACTDLMETPAPAPPAPAPPAPAPPAPAPPLPSQQLNQLMANNPQYDDHPVGAAQPAAQPAAPLAAQPAEQPTLRRSERKRETPQHLYAKYLHGLPETSQVNFPVSGFPLSP